MTTLINYVTKNECDVVEAYRLDRYDNLLVASKRSLPFSVVEAYRLDRYDNFLAHREAVDCSVVEAYRLDRYDNLVLDFLRLCS